MRGREAQFRLRSGGRRLLSATLRRTPAALLEPLRRPGPPIPGTMGERLRTFTLELARHRGIPDGVTSFPLLDRPEISFLNADSMVLQRLYWFGERGYEPGLVAWWRYFCRFSEHILELGANVGYYTVQGARAAPDSAYVAVEPHPKAARICAANLGLNGLSHVSLIEAAAVATPTSAPLRLTVPRRDHFGVPTGSFLPGPTEIAGRKAKVALTAIDVPAVPFTSLLTGVDLLKLDVEGQEYELLQAGRDQLVEQRPTIFLEVLGHTPRLRTLVAGLCSATGYSCYVPTPGGLVPLPASAIQSVALKQEYGTRDVILTTRASLPERPDS